MKIDIFSFTKKGTALSSELKNELQDKEIKVDGFAYEKFINDFDNLNIMHNAAKKVEESFENSDGLIFIGAVGIAVRLISRHIKDKFKDPAVICIDELGEYVIPILSGHVGGANKLAILISDKIGAKPVITTATDINNIFAVDVWAKANGIENIDRNIAKKISSSLLENKKIYIKSEFEFINTDSLLEVSEEIKPDELGIYLGYKNIISKNCLSLNPKCLCLGIGCKKGTDSKKLQNFCDKFLEDNNIAKNAISHISSIDIKKEEKAILDLAEKLDVEPVFFNANQLKELDGDFSSSEFVNSITGVDNVCERSACMIYPKLLVRKTKFEGMTLALSLNVDLKYDSIYRK